MGPDVTARPPTIIDQATHVRARDAEYRRGPSRRDVFVDRSDDVTSGGPAARHLQAAIRLGLLRKQGDTAYTHKAGFQATADPIRLWRSADPPPRRRRPRGHQT